MSITVLEGDCLEWLDMLPSGSFDAVIADPPYGTTQNSWDSIIPLEPLWKELWRVCRGPVLMTAAQPFTSTLVCSQRSQFKQELVWCKNIASDFLNANRRHMAKHESVLLFSRRPSVYNPQTLPGTPYKHRRTGLDDSGDNYGEVKKRTDTLNSGSRMPVSTLFFDVERGKHPTQKPVALFEYLIRTYTNTGDNVLDFSAGSGTTGVAALNTGRRATLIELNPAYCAIARQRIAEVA